MAIFEIDRKNLLIDKDRYYINNIALFFGVLQKILDIYL